MVRQACACFSQVFQPAVYSGHVAQSIRAMFAVEHSMLLNVFSGVIKMARGQIQSGAFYYHLEKVIRVSISVMLAALFYEKLRPNVGNEFHFAEFCGAIFRTKCRASDVFLEMNFMHCKGVAQLCLPWFVSAM